MVTSWTDEGTSSPSARVAANVTALKAIHVNELKTAIDAERTRRSQGAYAWTGFPAVIGNAAGVLKTHLDQLRLAIAVGLCSTDSAVTPAWTDTTITVNATPDKAVHINELRQQLNALEAVSCLCNCHGHCSCNCNQHCR